MKNNQIIFNHIEDAHVQISKEFAALYPYMTQLLDKASKIEFTLNGNQRFRQYIWTNANGHTSGWLCKLEHCTPQGRNLTDEHILLAWTMGGIIDYWLADESKDAQSFIQANDFTFSLTDSHVGIGGWEDNYIRQCKTKGIEPLDTSNFVTFALEANGNTTFYDYNTKEVFIYLHDDYSPFATTPANEYQGVTVYRYNDARYFNSYVEQLAMQWLRILGIE